MSPDPAGAPSRARIAILVTVLCAAYMISQFLRSSTGVIAPDIAHELRLSPQSLGVLSGAFFFAFAAAQIPVGLMLDRYGARATTSGLMVFAIAGSLVFAHAGSLLWLSIGRALMGIGCSCLLMGPLMIYTRWFPPARFSTLSGIHISAGTLGAITATAPLAWIAQWIGWRGVFTGTAMLAAAMAVLVWLIARDAPPGQQSPHLPHERARESLWQSLLGFGAVLRNPSLPHLLLLQFVGLGSAATLLGLWASPYLHDVHGLEGPARGTVLLVMAGCSAVGMLFWGQMDIRFDSRKKPILLGAGISMAMLIILGALAAPSLAAVTLIFALMGFCNGYAAIAIAHGRAIFPDHLVGRGISLLNMGGMAGAGVMQYIAGVIIGQFAAPGTPAPPAAYRSLFGFLAVSLLIALLNYSRIRDIRPGHVTETG
ncbi:MAG TPA: MFS transporter [Alphaproteobacteria bacterium]|nr:MFS transporter [Alphaproteobacteria bacterium]